MDRPETLTEIAEILELQEEAIKKHPPKVGVLYRIGRDALVAPLQTNALATSWSGSGADLSATEIELLLRYILSSSFISAWYHCQADKRRRDQAAQSCCTVIASLGPDRELVFRQYLDFERYWRKGMDREGISSGVLRRLTGLIIVAALILGVVRFCA